MQLGSLSEGCGETADSFFNISFRHRRVSEDYSRAARRAEEVSGYRIDAYPNPCGSFDHGREPVGGDPVKPHEHMGAGICACDLDPSGQVFRKRVEERSAAFGVERA